ncbi:MAG: hypothetical protein RIB61_15740 [Roseicyclus sp.]
MIQRPTAHPAPRRRWRQRYLLTGLGFLFAVSAVLRLGSLDLAIAQADQTTAPGQEGYVTQASAPQAALPGGLTMSLQAALVEVEDLRLALVAREAALADRERAVATAQALIEERLVELEEAEARLSALISMSDSAAETDLDRLTSVYETMPPEQAAALFEQMDARFAAGFLSRMNAAASARLMAELAPETAYAVSVVIATRNTAAPTLGSGQQDDRPDTEN